VTHKELSIFPTEVGKNEENIKFDDGRTKEKRKKARTG